MTSIYTIRFFFLFTERNYGSSKVRLCRKGPRGVINQTGRDHHSAGQLGPELVDREMSRKRGIISRPLRGVLVNKNKQRKERTKGSGLQRYFFGG